MTQADTGTILIACRSHNLHGASGGTSGCAISSAEAIHQLAGFLHYRRPRSAGAGRAGTRGRLRENLSQSHSCWASVAGCDFGLVKVSTSFSV